MSKEKYYLGIDIGTSKTAAVILDKDRKFITSASLDHKADVSCDSLRSEQSPEAILDSVAGVINNLNEDSTRHVCSVGLTGQMHGVLLVDKNFIPASNLITWQDKRCLAEGFIEELSRQTGHVLRTGYGCATLAWLKANQLPEGSVTACTIYDYIGSYLCGNIKPVIDPTGAASWGMYCPTEEDWDLKAAQKTGISGLLPQIKPTGSSAGTISGKISELLGLPFSIPVTVGIGDNQASMLAVIDDFQNDISLTLGTGGQISVVCRKNYQVGNNNTFEIRPFINDEVIVVGSCLAGGDSWKWLADTTAGFISELCLPTPDTDELYKKLNELGMNTQSQLDIRPHFLGERYDEDLRASISNIDRNNMTLGNLAVSLAEGIMVNLKGMLPPGLLENRSRIIASGNALRKNTLLAKAAEAVFNMPVVISEMNEEAACGAAVLSMRNVN